jgi:integrase
VLDVVTPLQRRTLALFRFLALSGWRESEGRTLAWAEVDEGRGVATLADTKTGRSVRPLGAAALAVLAAVRELPRDGAPSPYVFPGAARDGAAHRSNVRRPWGQVRRLAGLSIRLHDLRHSFTTVARGLGYGDHVIAQLVGHQLRGVTSRYGDVPDGLVQRAAHDVAARISAALG